MYKLVYFSPMNGVGEQVFSTMAQLEEAESKLLAVGYTTGIVELA